MPSASNTYSLYSGESMSSGRRVQPSDHSLIKFRLRHLISEVGSKGTKLIHHGLDIEEALVGIFSADHAYIVGNYLVVYEIGQPWYSSKTFLHEMLVLNLSPTRADFSVVPEFLEQRGREAGVSAVIVGTALARHDKALASLYSRHGFNTEALTLTKEL